MRERISLERKLAGLMANWHTTPMTTTVHARLKPATQALVSLLVSQRGVANDGPRSRALDGILSGILDWAAVTTPP